MKAGFLPSQCTESVFLEQRSTQACARATQRGWRGETFLGRLSLAQLCLETVGPALVQGVFPFQESGGCYF